MNTNQPTGAPTKRRRITQYGKQLQEKQDLKREYGLRENQFRKYVDEAQRMQGNAGDNLIFLLESRLDNLVYRVGLAATRRQARQFVSHGHFMLNSRRVTIPSILAKVGDIIEPRKENFFKEKGLIAKAPAWLAVNEKTMQIEVKSRPNREEITDIGQDIALVLQFYAR